MSGATAPMALGGERRRLFDAANIGTRNSHKSRVTASIQADFEM